MKKAFCKRIDKTIRSAKKQIDRNKYYEELIDNQIANEKIIKIPIIFAEKEFIQFRKKREEFLYNCLKIKYLE